MADPAGSSGPSWSPPVKTLKVAEGSRVLVVGGRGCGKTTLATRLARQATGVVLVDAPIWGIQLEHLMDAVPEWSTLIVTAQSMDGLSEEVRSRFTCVLAFRQNPELLHRTFVGKSTKYGDFARLVQSLPAWHAVQICGGQIAFVVDVA